ncbi:MAG: MmcQ/YjbR family DNA-binding protein [Saprospiraceae bacterium]|nr:MmcQ/YjbR family DNA-binding protein [Saprospiraceae bacterium]
MDHESLAKTCLSLRGTHEDLKWGKDLCYCVGEKIYCITDIDPPFKVSFKVTPEQFSELIGRYGIEPAPYLARHHWVLITDVGALKRNEWSQYIEDSYQQVFSKLSKKKQRAIATEE